MVDVETGAQTNVQPDMATDMQPDRGTDAETDDGIDAGAVGEPDVVAQIGVLLRARGERMTRPRRRVVQALADHAGHVRAEQVVGLVAASDPTVHRASVYRTLEALTQLGVLQHVHVGHGNTAYHLLRSEGAHLHASCTHCGAVTDLPPGTLRSVAARLSRQHGFTLDPAHVALSGTCADCLRVGIDKVPSAGHGEDASRTDVADP